MSYAQLSQHWSVIHSQMTLTHILGVIQKGLFHLSSTTYLKIGIWFPQVGVGM